MIIQSTRFGELEVAETAVIHFVHGIPGFPEEKAFIRIVRDTESPFSFLQSVTNMDLTFLMADPFAFFKDYEFVLDDEIVQAMGVSEENPPQVFVLATKKEKLEDMTVNLLAPVVINGRDQAGRQIILEKSQYLTRHKLFPEGLPQTAIQGGK